VGTFTADCGVGRFADTTAATTTPNTPTSNPSFASFGIGSPTNGPASTIPEKSPAAG
jgi:hypothetical protein